MFAAQLYSLGQVTASAINPSLAAGLNIEQLL
jgi:hypothetical protein